MRLNRASCLAVLAAGMLLASCSASEQEKAAQAGKGDEEVDPPKFDDAPTNVAVQRCPSDRPTHCSGPLLVTSEGATLFGDGAPYSDGERKLVATATVELANRGSDPVRVALLDGPISLDLSNGGQLRLARNSDVTGMVACSGTGAECLQGQPDRFVTLTPGDSPARLSLRMIGRTDSTLAASNPSIASGELGLQVYMIEAGGQARTVQVKLPKVAVTNQLGT